MSKRDIILGTVIIGGIVIIVAWVAMSVYEHEYVGEYVGLVAPVLSRFFA